MPLVRDRCICLRKIEYSETSQILVLFAREHGLIRAIAKGAHRKTKAGASKFGGGIDLLDLADAVVTHDSARELGTLCEWQLLDGHLELRRSLRSMYLGQYAAELVSLLFEEHDPHAALFDRFAQTLSKLSGPQVEEVFLAFQIDLLRESGYLAELLACTSCGYVLGDRLTDAAYFSPGAGGVVCRNCEGAAHDRISIDPRLLRLAQSLLRLPKTNGSPVRLPRLTRHQTDPLNRIFAAQIQHTLGKRLRLQDYVLPR
jgi:DNA repair protein RecO (recombination protein O)